MRATVLARVQRKRPRCGLRVQDVQGTLRGAVNPRLSEGSRLTLRGGSGLGTARVGEHTTHSAEVCWDKAAELSGDLRRARDQRGWTPREAVEAAVIDHLSAPVLQVTNMRGMLTY